MTLNDGNKGTDRRQNELIAAAVCLLLLTLAAPFVGRYPSLGVIRLDTLRTDPIARNLFFNLRIPRVILAVASGAMLGLSGVVFQTVFRNPIVGPDIIGVSQGAAFGAALAIVFFENDFFVRQCFAFIGGAIGLIAAVFVAARFRYGGWMLRFLLSGLTISALFSAGLTALKLVADGENQLHAIEYWLMGGFSYATRHGLLPVLLICFIALAIGFHFRYRLNCLTLPDESALSLGVSLRAERLIILAATVAGVAAVTSLTGIVGWVGLIVPHAARARFGADTRLNLPSSMLFGALVTLCADTVIRLVSVSEVPVGIVTSLFGVLFLMRMVTLGKFRP